MGQRFAALFKPKHHSPQATDLLEDKAGWSFAIFHTLEENMLPDLIDVRHPRPMSQARMSAIP